MKTFAAAVRRADEDDPFEEFQIEDPSSPDGTVTLRYYLPDDGQLALLLSAVGKHASVMTQIAGAIDFFTAVLEEDSRSYVVERLMDRRDPFGLEQVTEIMEWMTEEWVARPTQRSSESSQSPPTAGKKSRPRTTKST